MKRRLSILWKILLVLFVIGLIIYANKSNNNRGIKDVEVIINYQGRDTLIYKDELQNYLFDLTGNPNGKSKSELSFDDIENTLRENPCLQEVDLKVNLKGTLIVKAVQRHPIVRVLSNANQSFYIDAEGVAFLTPEHRIQRVLIANGNIPVKNLLKNKSYPIDSLETGKSQKLRNIYKLAAYIVSDEYLCSLIDQIYIADDFSMQLVPKIGNQIIVIGNGNNLDSKIRNLFSLYKNDFLVNGWEKYKIINLEFNKQIVCTKNN